MSESSSENLEGCWNGFTFQLITAKDRPRVLKHLIEIYSRHEPMMEYCGYTPELTADICAMATFALDQDPNLSFFVTENKSGKVAGVQIVDSVSEGEPGGFPIEFKSNQIARLETQLVSLVEGSNIFGHFGVDEFAEILYTSVDPEFRSQGLATEMFRRSLLHCKSNGFSVCASEFTSPATRTIGTKFGFAEVAKLKFNEFRDTEGTQILPNADDKEFIVVAARRI